jgi:hypothetical protein
MFFNTDSSLLINIEIITLNLNVLIYYYYYVFLSRYIVGVVSFHSLYGLLMPPYS